jgi:hypothetical protein
MDEANQLEEPEPPTRRDRWRQAFLEYGDFLPADDVVHCPECGATTLRVVGQGNPISRAGMCDFWCETCLIGIQLFGLTVPDPIEIVTAAFDPRVAAIPRYRVVM